MRKCLYCGVEIGEDSVIDFCQRCGKKAFGDKMLKAIVKNMNEAREKGNLHQGIISQPKEIEDLETKNKDFTSSTKLD